MSNAPVPAPLSPVPSGGSSPSPSPPPEAPAMKDAGNFLVFHLLDIQFIYRSYQHFIVSIDIWGTIFSQLLFGNEQSGDSYILWDSRVSSEDMEDMWSHPEVAKEWGKSGEKRGKVRFSHGAEKKPYLSLVEIRV